MSKRAEAKRQNEVGDRAMDFIRDNQLALEKGSRPFITSKGELFLHKASESSILSGAI